MHYNQYKSLGRISVSKAGFPFAYSCQEFGTGNFGTERDDKILDYSDGSVRLRKVVWLLHSHLFSGKCTQLSCPCEKMLCFDLQIHLKDKEN